MNKNQMETYSHSKLQTFEQCKLKYKFKYIDKIKPEVEKTIEAHLGTCVHDSLEWLYKEKLKGKVPELGELIQKYTGRWQEDYKEKFLIVKKEFKPENYFEKGVKFLIDYYLKHKPFDDGTISVEEQIWIEIEGYKITGFIDRLAYNKEKNLFEIHDYKTANSIPGKEKFEKDRQLAIYALAVKEKHGMEKEVLLSWHYLNHNLQILSKRTNQELQDLKKEIKKLIEEIESTKEFPPQTSILCDWCEYKTICPEFEKENQ